MKVKIKDIIVNKSEETKRFRKDFGDIKALAESIKTVGLIHPIVVDKIDGNKFRLLAGERRLRASILAGWSEIDVTLKDSLDDLQAKEIELEENVKRKDIDWEEQCEALRQIHELKQKIYGKATRTKKGWGIEDTAKLVGASIGVVSQDINLAKNLKDHPELKKKVKRLNKSSARKLVEQELEAVGIRRLMKKQGIIIDFNFENLPCEVGLKTRIPDNSIHCLITDPPFALDKISNVSNGASRSKKADSGLHYNLTSTNVGNEATMQKTYETIIPELKRVMVDGAHFYIFFGFGWYFRLVTMLRENGFVVDDQPIIWDKMRTSIPSRGCHYMSRYEGILFGYRPPQKRILLKPTPNILQIPTINPQTKIHPLQKPFDLLKILIENSTSPGEMVLDCFAGSGSTLLAAKKLQRSSRGFEIDEGNYLRALKWLKSESEKLPDVKVDIDIVEYDRFNK